AVRAPKYPPSNAATAINSALGHETRCVIEKATTATLLMQMPRKFLMPLARWMSFSPSRPIAASIQIPLPAPKYPPYMAEKNWTMIAIVHQLVCDPVVGEGIRNQRVIGACNMNRIVADRIRKGTNRANVNDGVIISSHAPSPPPITLVAPSRIRISELSFISRRQPNMPPNSPGHSATVLVALATFGSRPSQIKTGNVSSVPPPAMELTTPAKNAARTIAAA